MKQKTGRKLLSFLLTLTLVVGLMPGMGLTAYADESTSEVTLLEEDFEDGSLPSNWSESHTINDYAFNAVGQLFSNQCPSNGNYMMGCWGESYDHANNTAQLCTPTLNLSDYTSATLSFRYANPSFSGDIDGITVGYKIGNNDIVDLGTLPNVSDLTSKIVNLPSEALKENVKIVFTATCHSGYGVGIDDVKVTVPAVTPAATHSVNITPGDNMTKTTNSGAASQTGLSGEMADVVYTANDGYYFPTDYSVAAVNGISVTRDNYTQITVSGTPTADATIALTAPTAKTTPDAPTTVTATNCTTSENNDGKLIGVTDAMEYQCKRQL